MLPFPEDFRTVLAEAAESTLIALLSPGQAPPSAEEVHEALAAAGLPVNDVMESEDADGEDPSGLEWLIDLHFEPSAALQGWARVWLEAAPDGGYSDLEQRIDAQDLPAIAQAQWQLGMTFALGSDALLGFHRQLKLLAAAAPDAVLLLDADACMPRPAGWLRDAAESSIPPAASSLYSIHAVTDDQNQLWLHTHGLHRAGCPDLDLISVPEEATAQAAELISLVAALFLEGPAPAPGEPFCIGRDLDLLWLPWDAALEHLAPSTVGAAGDREDESHTGIRGVIFAPSEAGPSSTRQHLLTLAGSPQLYLSEQAVQRQVLLASERLTRFLALLDAHRGDAGWEFRIQLAEDSEDASPALAWFTAHGMVNGEVDVSHSDQRGVRSLDRLTDWAIVSPYGRFTPEDVLNLERRLQRNLTLN